ncbi:MAG: hypothetical protein WAV27_09670 [Xanthobacteraceae bacterium]
MPETLKSKFDLPLKTLVATVSLVFSIEIHELVHLLTARFMGIPSRFLNFTAVGIPMADVLKYPPGELAVMNGIAPLFSFVVLGCGTYFWLKCRPFKRSWRRYFLTWVTIFNLPYLGLQMTGMGGPSIPNGGGPDFATVFDYLGASHFLRAWLGVLGFVLFIILQAPLRNLLYLEDGTPGPHDYKPVFRLRTILGWGFVVLSFAGALAVCHYQILQENGNILIEYVFWALACTSFIPWRSDLTRALVRQWLAPCIVSTLMLPLILLPFGLKEENDFLTLWLLVIPTVLGGIYFRTWADSSFARQ